MYMYIDHIVCAFVRVSIVWSETVRECIHISNTLATHLNTLATHL